MNRGRLKLAVALHLLFSGLGFGGIMFRYFILLRFFICFKKIARFIFLTGIPFLMSCQLTSGNSESSTKIQEPSNQIQFVDENNISEVGEQTSLQTSNHPIFNAPDRGILFSEFFQYDQKRASQYGTTEGAWGQIAFGPSLKTPGRFFRYIGIPTEWGEAYTELSEFAVDGLFVYNTGWYPGGSDNKYYPAHHANNFGKNFAKIKTIKAVITTPSGTFDITSQLNPELGEVYALKYVPLYSYTIKYEGSLIDQDSNTKIYDFKHEYRWDPPQLMINPIFYGSNSAYAIKQTESWVDGSGIDVTQDSSYAAGLGGFWSTTQANGMKSNMTFSWTY